MSATVECGDGSVGARPKGTKSTRMVIWRWFVYFSCSLQVNFQSGDGRVALPFGFALLYPR
jgi:hypothetical protein